MHPLFANVPRETIDKLDAYAALLQQWQQHINLVGASTLEDIWHRHFADSAQLVEHLTARDSVIADIGSGAGFPGLVLCALGYTQVHLIESDQRKAAFLREAARIMGVTPHIHCTRMEALMLPSVTVYTSRACSSLVNLLNMLGLDRQKNSFCLFHKGKNYTKELEELSEWRFDLTIHPSKVSSEGVILEMRNINHEVAS